MRTDDPPTPDSQPRRAVYFDGTYRETMNLLLETRDYMRFREPVDRRAVPDDHRLMVNCEALRLTSRLTHIMAWLLIQKAVHAGEITAAEAASEDNRLAGQSVCRERAAAEDVTMPPALALLLERSYRLYTRVERLDALVALGARGTTH
jgi:regulator of CtrA degradation